MDLPDCPPGAEGYEDSVIVVPNKKPVADVDFCTKAELEFQRHLDSLKIKLEDGTTRGMVERSNRDIAGKWIYLCYPCAALCAGETVMQTHLMGKKHKSKLGLKTVWPLSLFEEHPYVLIQKGNAAKFTVSEKQPPAKELPPTQTPASIASRHDHNTTSEHVDSDEKYERYRKAKCHIQDVLDKVTAPLLGVEYLVEHPPDEPHHEPQYICTLCFKQGYPRTIINHMTCFWHRFNYLALHFQKAHNRLYPYRGHSRLRDSVINRLTQRIEDKFGRLRPVNIDKEEYERDKDNIHRWLVNSYHISEKSGHTFEEVIDINLIESLRSDKNEKIPEKRSNAAKEPSPPVVAAPSKPRTTNISASKRGSARARRVSVESLSDVSNDPEEHPELKRSRKHNKDRYEPYPERHDVGAFHSRHDAGAFRSRYALRNVPGATNNDDKKPPNHEYKINLAQDKRAAAEAVALKTLSYHEKNPEKHPLYPEEWKKFWNKRYKELQAEGKDTAKYDFKPEWIVYWTARMKELHQEELKVVVNEIYRKLCLTPPDMTRRSPEQNRKSSEPRRKSPDFRRKSPSIRRKSPETRHDFKYRSPESRRLPNRRRSPDLRHRLPTMRRRTPEYRDRRSPDYRSLGSPARRHSPPRTARQRSRSPMQRRSPIQMHLPLDGARRSRSPLSRRESTLRNRSPAHQSFPSMQTVLISDDELKPDDDLSPWNSDNDLESLGSLPEARSPVRRTRSRTGSVVSSRDSRTRRELAMRAAEPQDLGPPENVVATLRLLVALEDYLGSLGPKIVDLLTNALKMEKEKANSSEELLERDTAVVLMETAKEKLKGAAQAGLVPSGATAAVRAAIVRIAATLHEADNRTKRKQSAETVKSGMSTSAALPVAGVGAVDRAQIAQQMAAALVAQGKTDVTSEELASLVDAVVGMAEAKKREAEVNKMEVRKPTERAPPAAVGTASALQMLQFAYDESDKKAESKDEAPDAMDGLSDSDLETLLKNFSELSAEEQHSLIAYLKKLEAREPTRVERLRQYVSVAAAADPPAQQHAQPPIVAVESDDDDYTVEEVFNTAKQKVKEDQIRQEMEIVKKSLEESKVVTSKPESAPAVTVSTADVTKVMSTATGLLAMVQASLQSTGVAIAPPIDTAPPSTDVTTTNVQSRSFGDLPQPSNTDNMKPNVQNIPSNQPLLSDLLGGSQRLPMNQMNFNRSGPNDSHKQGSLNSRPHNVPDNRGNVTKNWEQNTSSNWGGDVLDNRGNTNKRDNGSDNGSNMSNNWGSTQNIWENASNNRGNIQDNWRNAPDQRENSWGNAPNNPENVQDNSWSNAPNNPPNVQNNSWGNAPNNPANVQDNSWGNAPHNPGNAQDNSWGNAPHNPGNAQDNSWGSAPHNPGNAQDNSWGNAPHNPGNVQDNWRNASDNPGNVQDNWRNTSDNRGNVQDNWKNASDNHGNMQNWGNASNNRGKTFDNRGASNVGQGLPYNQGPRGNFVHSRSDIRPLMPQYGNQNFVRRGGGGGRGHFRGRGRGGSY